LTTVGTEMSKNEYQVLILGSPKCSKEASMSLIKPPTNTMTRIEMIPTPT